MTKEQSDRPPPELPPHYVRQWREAAGLKVRELARSAGIDHSNLSKLEKFTISYTAPLLEKLAAALNCRPGDLLNGPPGTFDELERLIARASPETRAQLLKIASALID